MQNYKFKLIVKADIQNLKMPKRVAHRYILKNKISPD